MRTFKPFYVSAALALVLTSCGGVSKMVSTPVENIDAIDIIINDEEKIVEFNLQETEVIVESVSLDEKLYLEAFDHTEQEIEEDLTLEKEVIIHAFSLSIL